MYIFLRFVFQLRKQIFYPLKTPKKNYQISKLQT